MLKTVAAKRKIAKYIKLHDTNIAQKVEIIIEHFKHNMLHQLDCTAKVIRVLESFHSDIKINPDIPMVKAWPEPYKTNIDTMGASHLKHLGIARDDKGKRTENIERNLTSFGAPAVIYLCLHKELSEWSFYDLGLFSQSLMLAAQHYGLNTTPAVMLAAYPEIIHKELAVPEHLNIVLGIAVGYGIQGDIHNAFCTTRKPLDEFVTMRGI